MEWKEFVDFWNRTNEIRQEKRDDGEKHREVSCRAAQLGYPNLVQAAGVGKELYDFARKATNKEERKRYGGIKGILEDGTKDLRNNKIGANWGKNNPKGDCKEMSRTKSN